MTSGSAARSMPLRSPLPKAPTKRSSPLRLVPARTSSAAKAPFVATVVALLVGGLLGLLLLNTLVAQDSFALHDLGKQGRALDQREQDLSRQVQALQAPAALAAKAMALGMVPGGAPAFLSLPDGTVLGKPTAGVAPVVVAPQGSTTWTAPKKTPPPAHVGPPSRATASATKPATQPATKPGARPATKPGPRPTAKPVGTHP